MLRSIVHALNRVLGSSPEKVTSHRPIAVAEAGIAEHLNPGSPFIDGDEAKPVPRWPEHGAALVAANPEDLLETQRELVDRLLDFTPLKPAQFKELVVPALVRYASWVHLLPASEQHHHFGPGGLLRHGLEVANHAARMADGKQVGMELVPADRNQYAPRWKVAAMFGGLLHDIGKPLVDCGATDPDRTKTWPAQAGPLHDWLIEHRLSHYRIYWRSGSRHERHKAIGTSVAREILGKDLLRWLSEEPTHEVVDLMMMSIAQGRTANNLMSQIVSKADSLSVEEDLKQLAKRTQASAQGGSASNCSRIISELRELVESGKMPINRPGEPLWWTSEGLFAQYPRILDEVLPKLVAKQIPGIPASKADIAQILMETGFILAAEADTHDGKQSSNTWDLHITLESKGQPVASHKLRTIRFADPAPVVGNRPLPPPHPAEAKPPFADIKAIDKNLEAVQVVGAPADSVAEGAPAAERELASPPATSQDAPAIPSAPQDAASKSLMPSLEITGGSAGGRDRRDIADHRSVEKAINREKRGIPEALDFEQLSERLFATGAEGVALSEVFDRISNAKLTFGVDYVDTLDGLALRYPEGLEGLGISASDLMNQFAHKGWLVIESGSDRKINERSFGEQRRKCLIFGGLPGKVWEKLKSEKPAVLTERPRPKVESPADAPVAAAPPPQDRQARAPRTEQPRRAAAEQRPRPGQAPTSGAQDPASRGAGDRTNVIAVAESRRKLSEQQLAITAESISDLDGKRVEEIKIAARMALERDLVRDGVELIDASPTQIKDALLAFAKRNHIAPAPLGKALLDNPNPMIIASIPPMWDFTAVEEPSISPGFELPAANRQRLDVALQKLREERSKGAKA